MNNRISESEFKDLMVTKASSDLLVEFLGYDFAGKDIDLYEAVDEVLEQMPDDVYQKFCKMLKKDIETGGKQWE